MKKLSLLKVLEGIEDTRRERSVLYPLHEVLFIMLLAVICGATSYAKVEMFGNAKKEWLKKYISLEYGVPDACTFRNVIKEIDTEQLHQVFVEWMKSVVDVVTGVVAIDGKQARRTKDKTQRPLHVVSAFSAECRLVLGQLACGEKSNEITAIPQLLDVLELKGCIVTIDAMGTQTEIANKIIEKEADYILAVKGNQPNLHEDIQLFMDDYVNTKGIKETNHYAKTMEKGHGRIETRECYVCEEIDWLTGKEKWAGLSGIGMILCNIEENGEKSIQKHYYIYSCKGESAESLMRKKRDHWSIENGLHWVLDMEFREDESRARKDNSAENLNVLRHMAYNVLKSDTSIKGSFSDKQFKCLLDDQYLNAIVGLWFLKP